jgi:hypothetical protein
VTIATAMVFCHRFYLRQSHSKNDRRVSFIKCLAYVFFNDAKVLSASNSAHPSLVLDNFSFVN